MCEPVSTHPTSSAWLRATALLLLSCGSCAPAHRPGLPPSSPFTAPAVPADPELTEGVATGDVTSGSALVWFRTAGPARASVEWAAEEGGSSGRTAEVTTIRERDFTATVRLEGLSPATLYRYRVMTAGLQDADRFQEAASGRFRTAAAPDAPETVTFVWSGDLGGQQRCRQEPHGYAIFDQILRRRPAFAILVGDLIYGDDHCPAPPNAPGSEFLASTLDEYRVKHRYQRGDPALRRVLAAVPVYPIWDDHEVRNNFSGPYERKMPDGRRAFLDYWPVATPPEDPHRLYRHIRRGADLELFILDTRQYRSRNAEPDGPRKTMLGTAQRDWLLKALTDSTATWKVIVTSVPLSNTKSGTRLAPGNDSWAPAMDGTGFQAELRLIVDRIVTRRIRNVVWLTADVHYAQVHAYDPDGDGRDDFLEFICGPLSAEPGRPVLPSPALRPTTLYSGGGFFNFGALTVDRMRLRLEIVDEVGGTRFLREFTAREP